MNSALPFPSEVAELCGVINLVQSLGRDRYRGFITRFPFFLPLRYRIKGIVEQVQEHPPDVLRHQVHLACGEV